MDLSYIWTGWSPIWQTLIIGAVGYLSLVILLRGTGPRTMAKMTPLDFGVAVTLGSAFGRVVTAQDVSLVQALVALVLLVTLQWIMAACRARWKTIRRLFDAPPVLLYYAGQFQPKALRRHRLTEYDIHTAARQSGHGSLDDIYAVILDQDGAFSVIGHASIHDGSSVLPFIERHPADPEQTKEAPSANGMLGNTPGTTTGMPNEVYKNRRKTSF